MRKSAEPPQRSNAEGLGLSSGSGAYRVQLAPFEGRGLKIEGRPLLAILVGGGTIWPVEDVMRDTLGPFGDLAPNLVRDPIRDHLPNHRRRTTAGRADNLRDQARRGA
ncbi:MAG: hypothetical protein EA397_00730 [Deltaproteobacteria bacterium]|nr:MAG: hypothetical protein EA397_00730 [Deltaproteobacteria bacterium]